MKEYQARAPDLIEIRCQFKSKGEALRWLEHQQTNSFYGYDSVIGEAKWETDAEADKARLDWVIENGMPQWPQWQHPKPDGRILIDFERNAPKLTFTKIEL